MRMILLCLHRGHEHARTDARNWVLREGIGAGGPSSQPAPFPTRPRSKLTTAEGTKGWEGRNAKKKTARRYRTTTDCGLGVGRPEQPGRIAQGRGSADSAALLLLLGGVCARAGALVCVAARRSA